ncbi:protein cueball-like [Dendronephthya gigantea]|uniref:protein cueball-like n=1 Tax=Dendronephthya gigantea TaxID=151771 RepID=UPI001069EAAB|nr:protein cueball-like [Dendronephthya gigantea]
MLTPSLLLAMTIWINLWPDVAMAQVFQYFLVDNNKQTASVLDTIKLPTCTHIDLRQNVTLRGGIKSGNFTKLGEVADMQTCIDACCQDLKCDVAFMAETTCYSLKCFTERVCETVPSKPRRTNKSVQISHIVRGGGRGDDLETFSQQQGIEKYVPKDKTKRICTPSKRVYNASLRGGKYAGNMAPLNVSNIYECIERCCNRPQCDLVYWRNGRCHAVSCYTDELCKSSKADNGEENILVYINKRAHRRVKDKGVCTNQCSNGICIKDDTCACDVGFRGKRCNLPVKKGFCGQKGCGDNGRCHTNDTCVCRKGYFGYLCEKTLQCHPKCQHGVCLNNSTKHYKCRCDIGWEGKHCDKANGDIVVASEDGDEVLFTKLKEKDNDFGHHDEGPRESISSIGVALACALAATILGTAAIVFVTRRILKSRSTVNYELLREPLRHDSKKHHLSS